MNFSIATTKKSVQRPRIRTKDRDSHADYTCLLSWLQMIHETSAGREKHTKCEKLARKKGHTRDNVKINYTRFVIRLFSRTIKFYPLSHKKIPLSHSFSTTRWFEMRDTRNLSCEAA